jgi:mono/diheme cytochrome c family protein
MKASFKMIAGVVAALAILPNRASAANAMPALYTAAQAHNGAVVYQQSCEACHGASLEGVAAPALKGQAFGEMATAQGLTVDSLITVVANTMPQSDPGSLSPTQVNAVVAYILQQNSYPAGATALTPDTAARSHVRLAAGENKEVAATKADIREDQNEAAKKAGAKEDKTNTKVKLRPHKTKHAS